jgi:hypothetical protein
LKESGRVRHERTKDRDHNTTRYVQSNGRPREGSSQSGREDGEEEENRSGGSGEVHVDLLLLVGLKVGGKECDVCVLTRRLPERVLPERAKCRRAESEGSEVVVDEEKAEGDLGQALYSAERVCAVRDFITAKPCRQTDRLASGA